MAPKSHVFVVMAFLFAIQATYSNQCDNFYAKVTYALSHGKKPWKLPTLSIRCIMPKGL